MLTPRTLSCFAVALSFALPVASSHAANAYAVKPGDWDTDIWSASSGGAPEPGLRPGQGQFDAVQFRQNGVRVSVLTDVGTLSQVFLNNSGAPTVLRLNAGARMNVMFLALATGGGKSLVEVNGDAVLTVGDTGVRVAHTANGVGTMNISEGTVTVAGKFILSGKDATGTLNLASGSLAAPFLEAGQGTSALVWTGGTLKSGGSDLGKIENTGSGILDIGGTDIVNGAFLHKGSSQVYQQGPEASMRVEIESAKSFDNFVSEGPSGQVVLNGTIEIHLLKNFRPRAGEQFDIIAASKVTDEGIKLSGPAGANFQAQVVDKDGGQVLRITAR